MGIWKKVTSVFSGGLQSRARHVSSEELAIEGGGLTDGEGDYSVRGWLRELDKLAPLRAVVSRIASDVSTQEFFVRQRVDSKKWQRADEDTDEFCQLIENCWSDFGGGTFAQLVELCQIWDDTVGSWLLLKCYEGKKVSALIPVPPTMYTVTKVRELGSEYRSFVYFDVNVPGGFGSIQVAEEDAIWHRSPSFWDPSGIGTGLAQCLANEADQYKNASKYTNSFFANGATPHLIVAVKDSKMTDGDLRRLKAEWRKSHEGVYNAFRSMFVNREIEVKPIQPSQSDMQLDETKGSCVDRILMTYSMPGEILGINKNSNKAVSETSVRTYSRLVLLTRLKKFCGSFNRGMKRHFPGRQLWFVSPVREAAQDEREKTLGAWTNGLINLDQACQDLGYDPPGGEMGERRMFPANMVIVDKNGKVILSTAGQGGAETGGKNNQPTNNPTPGSGLGKAKDGG